MIFHHILMLDEYIQHLVDDNHVGFYKVHLPYWKIDQTNSRNLKTLSKKSSFLLWVTHLKIKNNEILSFIMKFICWIELFVSNETKKGNDSTNTHVIVSNPMKNMTIDVEKYWIVYIFFLVQRHSLQLEYKILLFIIARV